MAAALAAVMAFSTAAAGAGVPEPAGSDEKTRYEYAESLYMQGAYDAALEALQKFISDFPKSPYTDDAYYWLGMYFMKTGRIKDGLDQFKLILALLPESDKAAAAQFELAYNWYDPSVKERDPERAIAEFLKIPFFYPDSPLSEDAKYYAALCQADMGRYEQAATELGQFLDAYPDSEFAAPAGYRLGLVYLMEGRTDEALSSFQSVRDNHPAGLMSARALGAVELVTRARDKRAAKELYRAGGRGDGPDKFARPMGVALDAEGRFYVADTGNSRVEVYGVTGGSPKLVAASLAPPTLDKPLTMDEPAGVAVGPKGRVYVSDSGRDRVQVFSPEGELLATMGKKGTGPGELSNPRGVAVDDGGFVYVADSGNKRVVVYDPSGNFDRTMGDGASDPDKALRSPVAVALDKRGNLLVVDDSSDRVYGYDRKGALVMLYDKDAAGKPGLKDPSGIAVDAAGNVYVADMGKASVVMLDKDLKPVMEISSGLEKPSGVAVSAMGEVFVADYGSSQVVVLK